MLQLAIAAGCALSSARRSRLSGLKALAAENRPPLGGAKWNGGFPPALGAIGSGLYFRVTAAAPFLTLAFARFTALRLVPEILVGEKLLFSRSEHEIGVAVDALEYSILKLWHLPGSWLSQRYRTTLG